MLAEVLYTLGKSNVTSFQLVVRGRDGRHCGRRYVIREPAGCPPKDYVWGRQLGVHLLKYGFELSGHWRPGTVGSFQTLGKATPTRPPQSPTPRVTCKARLVSGGGVANAAMVVARMRGRFRACYKQAVLRDKKARGTVELVAKIGSNGEVVGVTAGKSKLVSPQKCFKAVVRGGSFAPPTAASAKVVLQLECFPQDDGEAKKKSRSASKSSPPAMTSAEKAKRDAKAKEIAAALAELDARPVPGCAEQKEWLKRASYAVGTGCSDNKHGAAVLGDNEARAKASIPPLRECVKSVLQRMIDKPLTAGNEPLPRVHKDVVVVVSAHPGAAYQSNIDMLDGLQGEQAPLAQHVYFAAPR